MIWDVIQEEALDQLRRHIMVSKLHERDVAKVNQLVDQAEVQEEFWPVWFGRPATDSDEEEVAGAEVASASAGAAAHPPPPKGRPAKVRPTASSMAESAPVQRQPEEPVVPPPAKKTKVGVPKDPSDVCNSAT